MLVPIKIIVQNYVLTFDKFEVANDLTKITHPHPDPDTQFQRGY